MSRSLTSLPALSRDVKTATINDQEVLVTKHTNILEAAIAADIFIPHLCYHPDLPSAQRCGICNVKVNGLYEVLACATEVKPGMKIRTEDRNAFDHSFKHFEHICNKSVLPSSPEIEEIFKYFYGKSHTGKRKPIKTHSLLYDPDECVGCDRCIRACNDLQKIEAVSRGDYTMDPNKCISCGACVSVCPTLALREVGSIPEVLRALSSAKILCLQIAPAARVSLAELFHSPVGTVCTGKIIEAAREIGFRYVFDTNFGADMTVIEEGTELINRIENHKELPLFTSCCPSFVNFVERYCPNIIPNLCTAKSPHLMLGAAIKSYFAEKRNLRKERIFVVSLMPCIAKKDEILRSGSSKDVDAVLTVREFAKMIFTYNINWGKLKDSRFDTILSESSSASSLFGMSGGVAESVLKYVYEEVNKQKIGNISYEQLRGFDKIRTATISVGKHSLNIAVCNGIHAARQFIETGKYKAFSLVEVMACPYGCIGGGGQPKLKGREEVKKRAASLLKISESIPKATSNDNSEIQSLYNEFIGAPNGEKAHELLHTKFHAK